jgi:cytochrome b561
LRVSVLPSLGDSEVPVTELSLAAQPTVERYSAVARLLHWLVLALLIVQFTLAWTMPGIHRGTTPETLINLHLSFGLLILLVIVLRVLWRAVRRPPPPPATLPAWQHALSRFVHWALYLLLIVIPMLGWINASWRGWNITFFWLFDLPHLVAPHSMQGPLAGPRTGDVHRFLATWVFLPILGLHVAAALYHALIRRDGVMTRMLPG